MPINIMTGKPYIINYKESLYCLLILKEGVRKSNDN